MPGSETFELCGSFARAFSLILHDAAVISIAQKDAAAPPETSLPLSRWAWSILFALVLFGALAIFVQRGATLSFDQHLLRNIRDLAIRRDRPDHLWGEESVIALTSLGAQIVLGGIVCVAIGWFCLLRSWTPSIIVAVALLGGIGLNHWLKPLFARPRPDVVRHAQFVDTASFPSGHALIATAVYLALGIAAARVTPQRALKVYFIWVAALLSFGIGLTRIYLGVHYPTDVLGGWLLGFAWAGFCAAMGQLLPRLL